MRRFVFVLSILFLPLPALYAQGILAGIGAFSNDLSVRNPVGKPCTVEYLTTTTQTLLDGTHITRTEKRIFYRDSQGRIRDEMYFPSEFEAHTGEAMHITIHDPVDKRFISLMPQNHTATVMNFPVAPARGSASTGSSSSPATSTIATTTHIATGSVGQMQSHRPLSSQKITTEKLDPETFNGVYAEGKRTTLTRPTGAIGNDRPLVTTTDRYTSSELGIDVYTKSDDPQSGERITEIKRLDQGEPDPSLFQVPEGYTIRDNGGTSGASATSTH